MVSSCLAFVSRLWTFSFGLWRYWGERVEVHHLSLNLLLSHRLCQYLSPNQKQAVGRPIFALRQDCHSCHFLTWYTSSANLTSDPCYYCPLSPSLFYHNQQFPQFDHLYIP